MIFFRSGTGTTRLLQWAGLLGCLLLSSTTWGQSYQTIKLVQKPRRLEKFGLQGDARAEEGVLHLAARQGFTGYSALLQAHKALGREGKAWVVWDTEAGNALVTLQGLQGDLRYSVFGTDGAWVVTLSEGSTMQVWEVSTGKSVFKLKDIAWVTMSPDGTRLVMAPRGETTIQVRSAQHPDTILLSFKGHEEGVNHVVYSPDGKLLVTTSVDQTARIWNAQNGKLLRVLTGHTNEVVYAVFSPDGSRVVTTSWDKTARVWGVATGKKLWVLKGHTDEVNTADFSADGTRIVTGSNDATARVWNAATGAPTAQLDGHQFWVEDVAFGAKGEVVTASINGLVRIWDVVAQKTMFVAKPIQEQVPTSIRKAVFAAAGERVATIDIFGTVQVWNAQTGMQEMRLPERMSNIDLSADGKYIATIPNISGQSVVQIWNTNGTLVKTLKEDADTFFVIAAVFSLDGSHVVTIGKKDDEAHVWNLATGAQERVLQGKTHSVALAAWSPDGVWLAISGYGRGVQLWNAQTGEKGRILEGNIGVAGCIAFSVDGRKIIVGDWSDAALIWDVATGVKKHVLTGHQDDVKSALFNGDGSRVVTTSDDGTVRVWDTATGENVAVLHPETFVRTARFVGDQLQLVHRDFTLSLVTLPVHFHQLPGFAGVSPKMKQADVLKVLSKASSHVACERPKRSLSTIRCSRVKIDETGGTVEFGFNKGRLRRVVVYVTRPEGEVLDLTRAEEAVTRQLAWLAHVGTVTTKEGVAATVENVLKAMATGPVTLKTQQNADVVGVVRTEGSGLNVRFFVEMSYTYR